MPGKPRKRKCKVCKEWFTPTYSSLQIVCGPPCAIIQGRETQRKDRRKENRKAKENLKTRSDWLGEAQAECNKWIRLRDKDKGCVSCDKPATWGGQWHASHYRPVGNCSALRFHPMNVHKACSECNNHKSGNLVEYRKTLEEHIGLKAVEWLEGPDSRSPHNWTIEDAKEIKAHYRALIKELEQ